MPTTPDLSTAIQDLESALRRFRAALGSAAADAQEARPSDPLFEALRAWRTEQARSREVPPYIIATDAVLRAIADAKPRDLAQLRAVRGMGETRATQYGADILRVVAASA